MFNPDAKLSCRLVRPDGEKIVEIPWPSDQLLIERAKFRRRLGVLSQQAELEEAERQRQFDLEWLRKVAGPELDVDEYEASQLCDDVLFVTPGNPQKSGATVDIDLQCVFGVISVSLRVPSLARLAEYERAVVKKQSIRGVTEVSIDLAASGRLFDELAQEPPPLPINYKAAAVSELSGYVASLRRVVVNP